MPKNSNKGLFSKAIYDEGVLGVYVSQERNVLNVHENLSIGATTPRPSEIELRKKSNKDNNVINRVKDIFKELQSFDIGDYVVHINYGIGIFDGIELINLSGSKHDCLKIIYNKNEKLFLPIENISCVRLYSTHRNANIALDSLSTNKPWMERKRKVRQDIFAAASKLLKVTAERANMNIEAIEWASVLYHNFTKKFGYELTFDQKNAIDDIADDFTGTKPVERLICGDAGFGKTEVAMHATFMITHDVLARRQVVIVAPTTLLVQQHYTKFMERFSGFNVHIVELSRTSNSSEIKQKLDDISTGKANIIIGTHAVLTKKIQFSNLSLLIIDEEQSFGVKQKEFLKNMNPNIHIISLSATPIPRTLQMSMLGLRHLSLITTPPNNRLVIDTHVSKYNHDILKNALHNELLRDGQVFYVCPRVSAIENAMKLIASCLLDFEYKISFIHGQMPPEIIRNTLCDFIDGKINILVSTNIVESGLDIRNANTIIVESCEMFGLGQLYQLRGRVGRSNTKSYAYFFLSDKIHSTATLERISILEEIYKFGDRFGAGFAVANYDMETRGFGNLLGEEQSGDIKDVGLTLYTEMLEEAIEQLRNSHSDNLTNNTTMDIIALAKPIDDHRTPETYGAGRSLLNVREDLIPSEIEFRKNSIEELSDISIKLPIDTFIPDTYIEDVKTRIHIYTKISSLKNNVEINDCLEYLENNYGQVPHSVQNLLEVVKLKNTYKSYGINEIIVSSKAIQIKFVHTYTATDKIINNIMIYASLHPKEISFKPNNTVVINRIINFDKIFIELDIVNQVVLGSIVN